MSFQNPCNQFPIESSAANVAKRELLVWWWWPACEAEEVVFIPSSTATPISLGLYSSRKTSMMAPECLVLIGLLRTLALDTLLRILCSGYFALDTLLQILCSGYFIPFQMITLSPKGPYLRNVEVVVRDVIFFLQCVFHFLDILDDVDSRGG